MTIVRRLDHIALAVGSTEEAVRDFVTPLGLEVVHAEHVEELGVRLTYADAGNAMIQLVEPVGPTNAELLRWVEQTGGGLHHVCFAADDVGAAADQVRAAEGLVRMGRGRGRPSAFSPGLRAGVRVEFTSFDKSLDVDHSQGFLR